MKTGKNNLTDEELDEVDDALDPFSFEKYCGCCCNFPDVIRGVGGEYCPFLEKFENFELAADTDWGKIGCTKFFD